MKIDVIMPQMGESVAEGTIVAWLKNVGDHVEADEILLEISTDKVDTEIPSPAGGILSEILVPAGETVAIGTVIARIETEAGEKAPQPKKPVEAVKKDAPEISKKSGAQTARQQGKRFYSPVVRNIAREEGLSEVELAQIPGSGRGGRVTKKDLLQFLESRRGKPAEQPPQPPESVFSAAPPEAPREISGEVEIVPMNHIRKAIAEHMAQSMFTAPHVTSIHEADVTRIMDAIEKKQAEFRQREGAALTLTAFVVEAAVAALKQFPVVNASLDGDKILYHRAVHIGMAVAVENGLVVPVIRHADDLNFRALARAITDLATRARTKKLSPDEVKGSTFSITNFGVFGTLVGTPIINQPNSAILGIGAAKKRPVVIHDAIAIRWIMYPSLTYDHRLIDGATGGQFMQYFVDYLENYDVSKI